MFQKLSTSYPPGYPPLCKTQKALLSGHFGGVVVELSTKNAAAYYY